MKPNVRRYRLMWDAHAWTGAIASVLLVSMLLLGVVSLFHDELSPWQEPRLRAPLAASEPQSLATIQRVLDERATPDAPKRIEVDLPSERSPWIRLGWKDANGANVAQWLHPETGEVAPERSDLGEFLFLMHFLYPLPYGMLIAGLLSVLLVLVVMTGLYLQLGKFRRELVRFRPREALRTVWSDLHKVLGSVGLPFQAFLAWTAAIVCLNAMVLQPVVVHTAFDGDVDAGLASIGYPRGPKFEKTPGKAPDVAKVLAAARDALPSASHYRLSVRNLGDASSHVDVRGHGREGLFEFTTVRVAANGDVLHVRQAGGPGMTSKVLEGAYVLHSGKSSGMGMRLGYALLGLFGALCIITGNLVWLARWASSPKFFDVLLARLTAGGCGAATVSLAAILVANQFLPDLLPQRGEWEQRVFYIAWCVSVLVALVDPRPVRSAQRLIVLSGVVFAVLPFIDAWKNARAVFDWTASPYLFWADIAFAGFGAVLLVSAWGIGRVAKGATSLASARMDDSSSRESVSVAH